MLAVRLPESLEYKLNRFSKISHKTKTDVVKEALVLFFNTQELEGKKSSYELGEKFFGRYESGRDDLSTSYKQKLKRKLDEKYSSHR